MAKQLHNITSALFLFFLLLLRDFFPVATLHAQQEPYYKGKTIRFVVGLSAGGFYDLWPRLVARHMGKYIPGNPAFVVQNMPGAGSIIAANYVYGVAKPDGLTLGAPHAGIYCCSTFRAKRSSVRYTKVQLDRLACKKSFDSLHAVRRALQEHRRSVEGEGAC